MMMLCRLLLLFAFACLLFTVRDALAIDDEPYCEHDYCNYNGLCTLRDGSKVCNCIENLFTGEHCQTVVDHCAKSQCVNSVECKTAVGQHVCMCTAQNGGAWCDLNITYPTKMLMTMNHIGFVGVPTTILLSVETMGQAAIGAEVTGTNLHINSFHWNDPLGYETLQWKHTKNLKETAEELKISDAPLVPYKEALYWTAPVTFWTPGEKEILLEFFHLRGSNIFSTQMPFVVLQSTQKICSPEFYHPYGQNAHNPLQWDIQRMLNIYPVVIRRCTTGENMQFHWRVYDGNKKKVIDDYGVSASTLLQVPRYRMSTYANLLDRTGLRQLYVMEMQAVDGKFKSEFTCYVSLMPLPPLALIQGGVNRKIPVHIENVLNGTYSRDFGSHPEQQQLLTYRWSCETKSGPNSFCKKVNSTCKYSMLVKPKHYLKDCIQLASAPSLVIPSNRLKLKKLYTFKLEVSHRVFKLFKSIAVQTVKPVKHFPLTVNIICVRNCVNMYSTVTHLLADCLDCGNQKVSYNWHIDNAKKGNGTKRLITDFYTGTARVTLKTRTQSGSATLTLHHNVPPENGKCVAKTQSGHECSTLFQFVCSDWEDSNMPILYEYSCDGLMLFRINHNEAFLYLPKDENINITLCDSTRHCTVESLPINVTPLRIPQNLHELKEFFATDGTNVRKMFENFDIQHAMCILHCISRNTKTPEMGMLIFEQLKSYKFPLLIEVEQLFQLTGNIFEALKPLTYDDAAVLVLFCSRIAEALEAILKNKEVLDIHQAAYDKMSRLLTRMLSEVSVKSENMQHQQLQTESIDWPDFDPMIFMYVGNWLNLFKSLSQSLYNLGDISPFMHEPKEQPYIVTERHAHLKVQVIEDMNENEHVTSDGQTHVHLFPPTVQGLQRDMESNNLLIQSLSFNGTYPFWWSPDVLTPSTNVFLFNIYSREKRRACFMKLSYEFDFLTNYTRLHSWKPQEIEDALHSQESVALYEVEMLAYSLLIVNFTAATADLLAALQIYMPPSFGYLWDEGCTIEMGTKAQTLELFNNCDMKASAYLGVISQEKYFLKQPEFKFHMILRQCMYWQGWLEAPKWSGRGCQPQLNKHNHSDFYCRCNHLSTYSAYEFPVRPNIINADQPVEVYLRYNIVVIVAYILLFLVLFALLFLAAYRLYRSRPTAIRVISREEARETDFANEQTIIQVRTGAFFNAGTTASIILDFKSPHTGSYRVVIFQDPKHPYLRRNTNRIVRVNSNRLQLPARLTISNDGSGDYSSWYCNEIQVDDLLNDRSCIYRVRNWIRTNAKYTIHAHRPHSRRKRGRNRKPMEDTAKLKCLKRFKVERQTFWHRFREKTRRQYSNWWNVQPVMGDWRQDDYTMNGFQRTCIWISKFIITIAILSQMFSQTTIENYRDFEMYISVTPEITFLLYLCMTCFLVGLLIEYIFNSMAYL